MVYGPNVDKCNITAITAARSGESPSTGIKAVLTKNSNTPIFAGVEGIKNGIVVKKSTIIHWEKLNDIFIDVNTTPITQIYIPQIIHVYNNVDTKILNRDEDLKNFLVFNKKTRIDKTIDFIEDNVLFTIDDTDEQINNLNFEQL